MRTRPTLEELAVVQRYVERVEERAQQRQLKLHLDNDVFRFEDLDLRLSVGGRISMDFL